MSENTYVTAGGFIQFDPQDREANGKPVTDVVIKTEGGSGKFLRITIWPELQVEKVIGRKLEKGDLVHVDGKFSSSTYQDAEGKQKNSLQISAFLLNVNGQRIDRTEREVEVESGGSEDSVF